MIIASAAGSADAHVQRAFFFVDGRFLRTDLADASAGIQVAWRNNATIALSYAIYSADEPMCCPKGGAMIVRYAWTGTRLEALDPIPPVAVRR